MMELAIAVRGSKSDTDIVPLPCFRISQSYSTSPLTKTSIAIFTQMLNILLLYAAKY